MRIIGTFALELRFFRVLWGFLGKKIKIRLTFEFYGFAVQTEKRD